MKDGGQTNEGEKDFNVLVNVGDEVGTMSCLSV
jgi:hypothetical protein